MSITALSGANNDWGRLAALQQSGRVSGFGPDRDGDQDGGSPAATGAVATRPTGGGLPQLAQDVLGFLLQQGLGIGDTPQAGASTATPPSATTTTATTGGTATDPASQGTDGTGATQGHHHHHPHHGDGGGQDPLAPLIGAMTAALNAYAANAKGGTGSTTPLTALAA